jgi:hypothetical protein
MDSSFKQGYNRRFLDLRNRKKPNRKITYERNGNIEIS